jgi:hypothetical protein
VHVLGLPVAVLRILVLAARVLLYDGLLLNGPRKLSPAIVATGSSDRSLLHTHPQRSYGSSVSFAHLACRVKPAKAPSCVTKLAAMTKDPPLRSIMIRLPVSTFMM